MEANYLKEIEDLKEKIKKLENYIKVKDYEYYNQVKKYMSEIDYYSLDYLKKNLAVREQLEFDYRMMVRARINNDFLEFCRYAYYQIELMINVLIKYKQDKGELGEFKSDRDEDIEKLKICLQLIQDNNNDNKKQIDNIKPTIHNLKNLRNIVSHRGSDCLDIKSRLEKMVVYQVQIDNISKFEEWNTEDKVKKKCEKIVGNDFIKCKIWTSKDNPEKTIAIAYVDLCNESAQQKLINIINDNNKEVNLNNNSIKLKAKVPQNKNTQPRYDFYQKSDYDSVTKNLKIFLTEICKLLK